MTDSDDKPEYSMQVDDVPEISSLLEKLDLESARIGKSYILNLMKSCTAYDVLPESNKVVVFDSSIPVHLAFYGLVEHDIYSAAVWDSNRSCFAGTLSLNDILDIMRVFYQPIDPNTGKSSTSVTQALSELTIASWRAYAANLPQSITDTLTSPEIKRVIKARDSPNPDDPSKPYSSLPPTRLYCSLPTDNLLHLSKRLLDAKIRSIPLLDLETNSVIGMIGFNRILQYLLNLLTDPSLILDLPLFTFGIGRFEDVVVVPDTASVISVLNVLAERQISAVPVVSASTGCVVDLYTVDDVAFLSNDPTFMVLDAPIGEVRKAQVVMIGPAAPLVTCDRFDTLHRALELFASAGPYCDRLVCVNQELKCTGLVSLSDIFDFLIYEKTLLERAQSRPFTRALVLEGLEYLSETAPGQEK